MAFRQRNIVGTIVDVSGAPVTDAKLSVKITTLIGYTATHVVVDRPVTVQTDDDGAFTIPVWCDEDSYIATDIEITFPTANSGAAQSQYKETISLSYEDGSDKDIGVILAETANLPTDGLADTSFNNLLDTRIDAKGIPTSDYAMKFTPNKAWHGGFIDHNLVAEYFFTPSETLGDCWFEAWFMVTANNTQGVICDTGHGGSHAILLEAVSVGSNKFKLYGNMFNGTTNVEANGQDYFYKDTIHHAVYAVIGNKLCLFLDGNLTAETTFTGTRTVGGNALDGHLYIGASGDHQGLDGYVFRARLFEETHGYGLPFDDAIPQAFTPQRVFGDKWRGVDSVFNVDMTKPCNKIQDTSRGYDGSKNSMVRSLGTGFQNELESDLPQWELKAFALPSVFQGTQLSIPEGADFFDDFSSKNLTQAGFDGQSAEFAPSISNRPTRTNQNWIGSSGGLAVANVGILEGQAVSMEQDINAVGIATFDLSERDIQITFSANLNIAGFNIYVGRTNASNQLQIALSTTHLTWVRTVGGSSSFIDGGEISNPFTGGMVSVSGNTVTVVVGGSTFTLSISSLSGTGFGFGVGALQRLKSFSVEVQ